MANTKQPSESEPNEVLPLCGVVVAKRTSPCKSHKLAYFNNRCMCVNDGCDFNADITFTR